MFWYDLINRFVDARNKVKQFQTLLKLQRLKRLEQAAADFTMQEIEPCKLEACFCLVS